jgi:hypothetical protein
MSGGPLIRIRPPKGDVPIVIGSSAPTVFTAAGVTSRGRYGGIFAHFENSDEQSRHHRPNFVLPDRLLGSQLAEPSNGRAPSPRGFLNAKQFEAVGSGDTVGNPQWVPHSASLSRALVTFEIP